MGEPYPGMRADEKALLIALLEPRPLRTTAQDVAESLGIPTKRWLYLLEDKWSLKGWWLYGVSARTGHLTAAGREKAQALLRGG